MNRRCCGPRSSCRPQSRSAFIRLQHVCMGVTKHLNSWLLSLSTCFGLPLSSYPPVGHLEFSSVVRNIHRGAKKVEKDLKIHRKTPKPARGLGLVSSSMTWGFSKNRADFILRHRVRVRRLLVWFQWGSLCEDLVCPPLCPTGFSPVFFQLVTSETPACHSVTSCDPD